MSAALLAMQLLAVEGEPKQLQTNDLLIYLAIIAGAMFIVIIAGLGYFTFRDDD